MTDFLTSGGVAGASDNIVLSAAGRRRLVEPGSATFRRWGAKWNGTGPYATGARVKWKGRAWVSSANDNEDEPGTSSNWSEFT